MTTHDYTDPDGHLRSAQLHLVKYEDILMRNLREGGRSNASYLDRSKMLNHSALVEAHALVSIAESLRELVGMAREDREREEVKRFGRKNARAARIRVEDGKVVPDDD